MNLSQKHFARRLGGSSIKIRKIERNAKRTPQVIKTISGRDQTSLIEPLDKVNDVTAYDCNSFNREGFFYCTD